MAHSDNPRDSCGGARRCGGNLLVASAANQRESSLGRNARALRDVASSIRASLALRKAR